MQPTPEQITDAIRILEEVQRVLPTLAAEIEADDCLFELRAGLAVPDWIEEMFEPIGPDYAERWRERNPGLTDINH